MLIINLADKITNFPPEIIQIIIKYYVKIKKVRIIEKIILHLDITRIDLHNVFNIKLYI